jgi:hypothetical protein
VNTVKWQGPAISWPLRSLKLIVSAESRAARDLRITALFCIGKNERRSLWLHYFLASAARLGANALLSLLGVED